MHSECVISREKNIKSCKRSVNSYLTFSIKSNSNIRSNGFVNSFFELWLTKNETLKDLFLAKLEPLLISSFWFSLRNGVKSFEKKARKHQNFYKRRHQNLDRSRGNAPQGPCIKLKKKIKYRMKQYDLKC